MGFFSDIVEGVSGLFSGISPLAAAVATAPLTFGAGSALVDVGGELGYAPSLVEEGLAVPWGGAETAAGGIGTASEAASSFAPSMVEEGLTQPWETPTTGPVDPNIAGLRQMGMDAGLQGPALENWVNTGGGPTIAGGANSIPSGGWSLSDIISGAGKGVSALNSGIGEISKALGMGSNPLTLGDIAKALSNYGIMSEMSDKANESAERIAHLNNPLEQPQRQRYQAELGALRDNPASFFDTNPAVKGMMNAANNQFQANTGKMGTGGTQFSDYLNNLSEGLGKNYYNEANLLAGLGGFTQNTGGTASGSAGLTAQGLNFQNEAFRGFGQDIFKQQGPIQGQTGQSLTNPNTTLV